MILVESFGIGIGKTELSKSLNAAIPNSLLYLEKVDHKYLDPFYEDVKKGVKPSHTAFAMQFYLMSDRFFKHREAVEMEWETGRQTIHDRGIIGDGGFAYKLLMDGYISSNDYEIYISHRKVMEKNLLSPQVVIRLEASPKTCISRIKERMIKEGLRTCECAVTEGYLEGLREAYDKVVWPWFESRGCKILRYDWEEFKPIEQVLSDVKKIIRIV